MGERAALVKFGQQSHILQLREEGLLYMNNLPYFWGIEDEELRGDPCDSVDELARGEKGTISKNGKELPVQMTGWTLRTHPADPENINIFCMYALRPFAGSFPVDEKNLRFGDYALVVTDVPKLIQRIESRFTKDRINGSANLVEYVDDDYVGEVGPFRKLRAFAYQSEWRVVCYNGPGEARTISIGSIEDISIVLENAKLNDEVKICS